MKKLVALLIAVVVLMTSMTTFGSAIGTQKAPTTDYEWGNLPIGAHGFVTGMVMHPLEKDLMYIRTDVGGAYRWDKEAQKWIQLCDSFSRNASNFYGIDGIAVDPQNPDIVYIAAGTWTWGTGDVLKSTDRGKTWQRTGLNKTFYANGGFRSLGECIAVDPVNSNIVYCGTAQDGLWKSEDGAFTWKRVGATTIQTTVTDYSNPVRNVVFDTTSVKGGICQTIYAGMCSKGVYSSLDGGITWNLVQGSPATPRRMELGKSGALYVSSNTGLFKLFMGIWTEISAPDQIGKNHNGIDVDPTNENIMMCVGYSTNLMALPIYRSEDGGKTWVNKRNTAKFTSILPWEQGYTDFSSNTSMVLMDPFDNEKAWISDFFGVFTTKDINAEPNQSWTNPIKGIEEVVPRDAICPPTGKYRLITAIADVDGFPFEDVTQYPTRMIRANRDQPWMMGSSQIAYCEEDPNIILRVGIDWNSQGKAEVSVDNSENWTNILSIPHYFDSTGKDLGAIPFGRAAVSAKKNPSTGNPAFVIIPAYNPNDNKKLPEGKSTVPLVSLDLGKTWQQVKGFPEGTNIINDYWDKYTPIASDRVNGNKFYICGKENVYVSTDAGLNWTKGPYIGGDENSTMIRTAPNMEGDVWISKGADGVYHSTNSGATFQKLPNITNCISIGFGKEAPGKKNPTIYIYGTINAVEGMYRSIDMGKSWERINDDQHKIGNTPNVIVGDMQTFGVVYVGSDGRGFFVGKPEGTRLGNKK